MKDEVASRLRALAERGDGTITPEAVIDDARSPDSPLHGEFEWDDSAAAHAYRLDQARHLIRSVRVEFRVEQIAVSAVRYVRDPRADKDVAGYIDVRHVKRDEEMAREVLIAEAKRVRAALTRMRELAAFFERQADVDLMIGQIDELQADIARPTAPN